MKLSEALQFPFRGPHAWPNLGFLALCFLIPIVGPMVVMGFSAGVEKKLVNDPHGDAPRFDFGNFTVYLRRGVAPFVASLLSILVLLPIMFILIFGVVLGVAAGRGNGALVALLVLAAVLLWFLIAVLYGVVFTPILFRAGVEQKIGAAFDLGFLMDYFKRVGLLTLGINLLLMLITLPLLLIMCIPFIQYGVFAALLQVQAHIRTQLYLTYLARGGQALPLFPEDVEGAFPVIMTQANQGPAQ